LRRKSFCPKKIERRKASNFRGKYTGEVFANKDYLKDRSGKLVLLDVREREFFTGEKKMDCVAKAAIGIDRAAAIVTYCDTGQCCPIWSYLLKQVLGYTNVRLYVGSMQEWMQDSNTPVAR
jgi:3-mercaptopyruvate sulfurtransferase SseA